MASYLLTQDPDFGDYWSWWVSTFFGLLGGVIGVYIIFGTDAARSNPFRAIVLGAVFGLSWPAVFKIGASMALTRNQEHTDTTEVSSQADDELKGALNTYKSELGDLTKPLTNGTTNSDDPTQGISVREQKVEQMMMIIPLLPDRETKRSAELAVAQAMEIVFESANAALADKKNFFREIQEVASQEKLLPSQGICARGLQFRHSIPRQCRARKGSGRPVQFHRAAAQGRHHGGLAAVLQ